MTNQKQPNLQKPDWPQRHMIATTACQTAMKKYQNAAFSP